MDWRLVLASVACIIGGIALMGLLALWLGRFEVDLGGSADAMDDLPDYHTYGDSPLVPKGLRGRSEHGGVSAEMAESRQRETEPGFPLGRQA